jgi:hypothetical protein
MRAVYTVTPAISRTVSENRYDCAQKMTFGLFPTKLVQLLFILYVSGKSGFLNESELFRMFTFFGLSYGSMGQVRHCRFIDFLRVVCGLRRRSTNLSVYGFASLSA